MKRLFGTSGVRRKAADLSDEFAKDLGSALATSGASKVAVGRDTRASGPALQKAFVEGLTCAGSDAVLLGVVPTPTVGVATAIFGTGIVVTASHNPPEYNGFKFFDQGGAFKKEKENIIEELFEKKKFKKGAGKTSEKDYIQEHIRLIHSVVGDADGVKVMVDCAGGAGSKVTPKLLDVMGCKKKVINDNVDGVFPHGLEPTEENLKATCDAVRKSNVDVGFAHDGDADRTCAIGADGKLIEWDTFLTVLASAEKKVVTTVDASMRIEEFCNRVYRVAVGDVAVAEGIRKYNAGFGGEPSGTYIFPDIHVYPDGVATVAKAVKLVSDGTFYELVKDIPSYPMQRVKMPVDGALKDKVMAGVRKALKGENINDIDGVRLEYDYGWVLIRPSGTEDYVRVTAEAKSEKKLAELVDKGKKLVKSSL